MITLFSLFFIIMICKLDINNRKLELVCKLLYICKSRLPPPHTHTQTCEHAWSKWLDTNHKFDMGQICSSLLNVFLEEHVAKPTTFKNPYILILFNDDFLIENHIKCSTWNPMTFTQFCSQRVLKFIFTQVHLLARSASLLDGQQPFQLHTRK